MFHAKFGVNYTPYHLQCRDFHKFFFCLDGDYIEWLVALANEGLEQIHADSYIGIEIRRPWVEL